MSSEFLGLKDSFYILIKYYPRKGVMGELYYYDNFYIKIAVFDYDYEINIKKYKLYLEFIKSDIDYIVNNKQVVEEIIRCFKEDIRKMNLHFVDSYENLRDCVITLAEKLKDYILTFKEVIEVL